MEKKIFLNLILGLVLLLSACSAASEGSIPITGATVDTTNSVEIDVNTLPATVTGNIQYGVATGLNVLPSDVQIDTARLITFNNTCLGLPKSGESCAEVLVPGYVMSVTVNGMVYEVHASQDGANVRWK